MTTILVLIFLAFGLLAAGFVAWPILARRGEKRLPRAVLALSATVLVLGIGLGVYSMLGQPQLALRTLTGPSHSDVPSLVATLALRVRDVPNDPNAWILLGRGYLAMRDPSDAAKAFARALPMVPDGPRRTELYSAYGEAETLAAGGVVTDDARQAFERVMAADPKDFAARFYLGLDREAHGQYDQALALWQGLLDDAPQNAPWRPMLTDRVAQLKMRTGGQAPDIGAMVAGLDARLRQSPDDPEGWQRLIRAYAVLGQTDKAEDAYARAKTALAGNAQALAAIDAEAKARGLR